MIFFKRSDEENPAPAKPQELEELRGRAKTLSLPEHIAAIVDKELEKLSRTDPSVAEHAIGQGYVDWLCALPWNASTEDSLDFARVERILSGSHAGLFHVKERLLEFLAGRTLAAGAPPHVLVVDDEEIARMNLEHVLKKEGYAVRTAANGQEALDLVRQWSFDLIVTDLKMDKMDGMTLLSEAGKLSPATQIVIVTGYATVQSAVQAMRTGAAHYLTKPISLDELRQTVRELLGGRKALVPSRGPVLCFTGPPGTGKTSIGMAIAEALGRTFHRMSMAGLRDEAELRGHRRTYVGAMPGKIIQAMRRLGVNNPVLMLDEIDKVGQDFRGDPGAAFLEILDPEQNRQFLDLYIDAPFDLSQVMFIATANDLSKLDAPLRDRLEIVNFPGYTEAEKLAIATRHLIPRQCAEHGLVHPLPEFAPEAVRGIIRDYTNEAGVRGLDREIGAVCRKLARIALADGGARYPSRVDTALATSLLGPRRFTHSAAQEHVRPGVVHGLVWSDAGGEIVLVEAASMKGAGQLILTGSLGEVLKESAQTALSYIRGNAEAFGLDPDFFAAMDLHIHIPAGAIPKDGPSAGITILMALLSLLTGRRARPGVALTGEMSLGGMLLPVSGVREKILAALRGGVDTVCLPEGNRPEVEALEPELHSAIRLVLAREASELADVVLQTPKATTEPTA
ncbi:ATP-dependent Lon protease [Humidesulfovibrio mexicanus]|uniref:endopeptidase La n=1 Tax=Humidesulfovibrio mexicanus TaxID=147047 RepID=A0A239BQ35_9BACT|nr:S16 family serine protease [Humidesulfovibrio mexicanus]SNS10110.1 ATP-dependent Lon protease [Humidesulfovibrio mexicanus]